MISKINLKHVTI